MSNQSDKSQYSVTFGPLSIVTKDKMCYGVTELSARLPPNFWNN